MGGMVVPIPKIIHTSYSDVADVSIEYRP